MADEESVGDISVGVTPNTDGFVKRMTAEIMPAAEKLGDDIGNAIGDRISQKIREGIGDGMGSAKAPAEEKGGGAGKDFGGAFAREAKARIEAAFKSLPEAKLDVNASEAEAKLAAVRAELAGITKGGTITLDDNTIGTVARLQAELDALSKDRTAHIAVRVDAAKAAAELLAIKAEMDALDGSAVKAKAAVGSKGGGGLLGALLLLTPALIPIGAAASAALGSFALLGIAGVAAVQGINDEQARGTGLGLQYSASIRQLSDDWDGLKSTAADNFLAPFQDAVTKIHAEMPDFNTNIGTFAGLLGQIGSAVVGGLVSGFNALSPLLTDVGTGFLHLAQHFEEFSSGDGIQKFSVYAEQTLPQVEATLSSLGHTAVTVIHAFAPFGSTVLRLLGTLADVINALPIGLVTSLATAFGTLYGTMKLLSLASLIGTKFGNLKTKLSGLATSASGASLAFTGVGAALGVLGLGVSLGLQQMQKNNELLAQGAEKGHALAASFREGGAAAQGAAAQLAALKQVAGDDPLASKEAFQATVAVNEYNAAQKDYAKNASVSEKQQDALTAAQNTYTEAVQNYGAKSAEAAAAQGNLQSAQQALDATNQQVAAATSTTTDKFAAMADKASTAKQKIDDLNFALDNTGRTNISAAQANFSYATALDTAKKSAQDANATDLDHNKTLADVASAALDVRDSMIQQGDSQNTVVEQTKNARAQFIAVAEQMGFTASQAKSLADQYGLIPGKVTTDIGLDGYKKTSDELLDVRFKVKDIPPGKTVNVGALTKAAQDKLKTFGYKVTHLPDGSVTVTAPTKAASDNLDAFINKNRVITVGVHTQYVSSGSGAGIYVNGVQLGHADGGYIQGPGTGTSDSIPSWLSNGEFVNDAASTKRNRAALEALNNGARAYVMPGGNVAIPGLPSAHPSGGGTNVTIYQQPGQDSMQLLAELDRRQAFAGAV